MGAIPKHTCIPRNFCTLHGQHAVTGLLVQRDMLKFPNLWAKMPVCIITVDIFMSLLFTDVTEPPSVYFVTKKRYFFCSIQMPYLQPCLCSKYMRHCIFWAAEPAGQQPFHSVREL
jgi:hypothetical protein